MSAVTRTSAPARVLTALLALLIALTLLLPVAAGAQSLDDAVEKREGIEAELDAITQRIEQVKADLAVVESEIADADRRRAELVAQSQSMSAALVARVRMTFKHGDTSTLAAIIGADGPAAAVERASLMAALNAGDIGRIEGADNLRIQLEQIDLLRASKQDEFAALETEMLAAAADLGQRLGAAKSAESELRTRADRQRTISKGLQTGTYACIMARTSFIDSWGFPRSGGRRHQGTDVMAAYNEPVYAFTTGRIERMKSGGLGGIVIYLRGDDGHRYYYAHLAGYAGGITTGTRVEAGQLIAYNGASGNARGGAPHVHYEVHPNGGSPVNPYPWLVAACR